MAPNLAIVAIPAYYLLSTLPHFIAVSIATKGDLTAFDNRNPRSSTYLDNLKKTLTPGDFARFERCESAQYNNLENLPLFASAVIVGLLADGVGKGGILTGKPVGDATLRFVYSWFAIRAVYNVAYISTSSNKYSFLRSATYFAGVGVALQQFWNAAQVLGA